MQGLTEEVLKSKMIVYLFRNLKTDKCYVGKTETSFQQRWSVYLCDINNPSKESHLYSAFRKDGLQSFKVEILGIAQTKKELLNLEKLWILTLRSYDSKIGYNKTYGGEGGGIPSEYRRVKSSEERYLLAKPLFEGAAKCRKLGIRCGGHRKGISYKEIYGEKAINEAKKRRETQIKKWESMSFEEKSKEVKRRIALRKK